MSRPSWRLSFLAALLHDALGAGSHAANKAAIRASGQTRREFVAACRAGNETSPDEKLVRKRFDRIDNFVDPLVGKILS
ncbi:MAG: hypothetical protein WB766_23090 [Roseiarcus sp.]